MPVIFEERIVSIACGEEHTLFLSVGGEVFQSGRRTKRSKNNTASAANISVN